MSGSRPGNGPGGSKGVGRAAPEAAPPPEGQPWTVLRMIRWSAAYLDEKGVPQGRLDGEHLLAHVLGLSRLQLYLQYERPLIPDELEAYKPLLLRRARREPLQYILGRTSFRELELRSDARALVPRPETERLAHEVLEWARDRTGQEGDGDLTALDVGTGSGCIALSLALEGPFQEVLATDASSDALELASENIRETGLGARVSVARGRLFEPVGERRFDVVVSNPPYVAEAERGELEPEVREWEPASALFAGKDGLRVLRPLVAGAPAHLLPGGLLALEVGLGQAETVAALVEATGAFGPAEIRRDLTDRPRMVLAERRREQRGTESPRVDPPAVERSTNDSSE